MSQTIVIEYINYIGEPPIILFTPFGENNVFNIGEVTLPYTFDPHSLTPPKEIYGSYNIVTSGGSCSNIVTIDPPLLVSPTPTKTQKNFYSYNYFDSN